MRRTGILTLVLLTGGFLTASVALGQSKMPMGTHDHGSMSEPGAGAEAPMSSCTEMMKMHDEMQAKMNTMDAKLQGLVEAMNRAKGPDRIERMAAVVNELVSQRSVMRDQMMSMAPKMMKHMMSHMREGMMKGMTDGMSGCPMMGGADGSSGNHADRSLEGRPVSAPPSPELAWQGRAQF